MGVIIILLIIGITAIVPIGAVLLIGLVAVVIVGIGSFSCSRGVGGRSGVLSIIGIATRMVLRGSPLTVVLIRRISAISITLKIK